MEQQSLNGSCPMGHDECPLLEEIIRLREERDHLRQLSITDPLTGYYNYRHMMNVLDQEMERTRRTGLAMGLIMIDLDHFKQINDNYGHPAGDKALQWASRIWRDNIRRIDVPCRYGGEEFAIILPGTDLSKSVKLAERLRRILAEAPLHVDGHTITLTASFGVGAYRGTKTATAQRLIDCADHMLIRAKVHGRNRVCSEIEESQRPPTEVTSEEREALFSSRMKGESSPCADEELQEE